MGAVLVAAGGFWSSWRQSNFNVTLTQKNNVITHLQLESANAITGGNSFAYNYGYQRDARFLAEKEEDLVDIRKANLTKMKKFETKDLKQP